MDSYSFPTTPKANADSIVAGPQYRFTILTDRLLRYEWAEDGKFEDRASTFAVNRELPTPSFQVLDSEDDLKIITDHFHLTYDKKRFSSNGLMASFSAKVTLWGAQWRYGLQGYNLGGTARTLDEVDGRCDLGSGVLSRDGYATIDDSTSMLFDGQGFVAPRASGDRVDGYLFAYGHDYKAAIKAFYHLSGKQPVLPRWALGNWWSRYYRYTQQEYLGLMDKFIQRKVPLSVAVVDMDWHLVSDDRVPHAGWTGYTWDDRLFPDPPAFGRELHDRNLKITLNDHPHSGVHHHEDAYEEMARAIGHDTSKKAPIVFDPTSKKFMDAFMNILHRNIENVACDFWWIDWQQGPFSKVPGLDPLWLLNHFLFLDNNRDAGKLGLIFSRYAGPGSHRYPVGFSGDTIVTWASLAFQPEFTATASNIGYGWWSHDIGGHMLGGRDDELVTRWVQYGVFSPLMRLHSSNNIWGSKEPWLYRPEYTAVIEDYMRLRHRLVPYLYNNNLRSSQQDEPLVQPMYWTYPDTDEAYSVPNQFVFGADLIVAPVVTPRDRRTNLASVKAWLPPVTGHYIDLFSGLLYDGARTLTLYRTIHHIPVLARSGTIIPLDAESAPVNGCKNPESLSFWVIVGNDAAAEVHEDPVDDVNQSATGPDAKSRQSKVTYQQSTGQLTAEISGPRESVSFEFLGLNTVPSALAITLNGDKLASDAERVQTRVNMNEHGRASLVVVIKLGGDVEKDQAHKITIELGSHPQLQSPDILSRIETTLLDYQVNFDIKDQIWKIVTDKTSSSNVKFGQLLGLKLEEQILGPITELLLADSRTLA